MNKSKKSLINAISSVLLNVVNGLFALYVTKLVIVNYGSDFNGLNSTATQFISMLLLIEAGFTIASNVALFTPMANNDINKINRILSATKRYFNKTGTFFIIIGIFASFIFALLINSDLPPTTSFLIFAMTIISTGFNLLYATKYRILLQSENKEYVLNWVQLTTIIFSNALILITISLNGHMLLVRFSVMIAAIINSLLVSIIAKKQYTYINFDSEPDYEAISGTKDIFIQKVTSMIYSTIPILFISFTVGTVFASIYVVYNNVFRFLKSIMYSIIKAPRIGFGKLIAEKNKDEVFKVFQEYEIISNLIMLVVVSAATVLIMPFIKLYTNNIVDANYYDWTIAIILIGITFFELIHIPSGNIINMAGKFKVGRKIQSIASILLIVSIILGFLLFDFYGIVTAVLLTAILLAFSEIIYIYHIYFVKKIHIFLRVIVPNIILITIIVLIEIKYLPEIDNYLMFIITGFVVVGINSLILFVFNILINRELIFRLFRRFNKLFFSIDSK